MGIAEYFILSIVFGAILTLLLYALGKWRGWFDGKISALISFVIGFILIWFIAFSAPQVAHNLGDMANNGSLVITKVVCTIGWFIPCALLGKFLP